MKCSYAKRLMKTRYTWENPWNREQFKKDRDVYRIRTKFTIHKSLYYLPFLYLWGMVVMNLLELWKVDHTRR